MRENLLKRVTSSNCCRDVSFVRRNSVRGPNVRQMNSLFFRFRSFASSESGKFLTDYIIAAEK